VNKGGGERNGTKKWTGGLQQNLIIQTICAHGDGFNNKTGPAGEEERKLEGGNHCLMKTTTKTILMGWKEKGGSCEKCICKREEGDLGETRGWIHYRKNGQKRKSPVSR